MKENKSKKDAIILKIIFVVLIVFNLVYAAATFFPEHTPGFLMDFYNFYQEHMVFLTVLEFVGVATVMVDAIIVHDNIKQPNKFLFLATVTLFVMAFIYKAFIGYLEAVFNFPS